MEPSPLCPRQVIAASEADCSLHEIAAEALAGVLTETPSKGGLPMGVRLVCPPFPQRPDAPVTEQYIVQCKAAFRPRLHDAAAFYYLSGADCFRALRAAVIALTDMTGRNIVAEIHAGRENRMEDGTDCLAAVGVLQKIGVSTVILTADEAEDMESALERIAPYARLSVGVRVPAQWLRAHVRLTNAEVVVPMPDECAHTVWDALVQYEGCRIMRRDHDDMILAPDGRDAHFVHAVIDISDEIRCDHRLEETLLEIEDEEAAALKLLLIEEDDLYNLETDLYMLSRPVCLCAETPELLEKALRIYHGLAIYDGTYEQDAIVLKYFRNKYGLICL